MLDWGMVLHAWWGVAWAAPQGVPGVAIPIYAASNRCRDPRYPQLAGPWIVACGGDGQVDRVLSLHTGAEHALPFSDDSPGVGPGYLVVMSDPATMVHLTTEGPEVEPAPTPIRRRLVAPPSTDGAHIAVLTESHTWAFSTPDRARKMYEAQPAGWFPPALAWPWVAWVQAAEDGTLEVRALEVDSPSPVILSENGGKHVTGPGAMDIANGRLAWVEPDAVVVMDPLTGERTHNPARTGFNSPITLWNGVVCWETRDGTDLNIECSDGLEVSGAGHQSWPSRWDRWLLYREGDQVLLLTATESPSL